MRFFITGGRQNTNAMRKEEWHRCKEALVVSVDTITGACETCLEYKTPLEACASDEDPNIVFKAGSLRKELLYLCTQTEVLVCETPSFHIRDYISLPCFNDLHHVYPKGTDSLFVAVTGLDMVVQVDLDGNILREWGVLGQNPWDRFSPDTDYRRVVTTKPHHSHPNFVFAIDDEIWVTRFEQKDAICITSPNGQIPILIERPHDGIVFEDTIYFTTVDGNVVIVDALSKTVVRVIDLNKISSRDHVLGWCRGLSVLSRDEVVVGFSRIRPTSLRENLRWMRYKLGMRDTKGNLPTRIVSYDLKRHRENWEINLEPCGLNALFSVLPSTA